MEQLKAKLAVIMPAYNAGQYIERAVRSVLSQDYAPLQLIVVDDGSTDDTLAILQRIALEDKRLLPLSGINSGPALARNRGLDALESDVEYVMFADADDELLPDAVSYAMDNSLDADLVFFGFTIINPDGSRRSYCEPEQLLDRSGLGDAFGRLYKSNLFNQVWGKLYKAELLKSKRFQNYHWGEDRLFVFDCLATAHSIRILPECKYRYIMHPGESLISKFLLDKPQVCMEADAVVSALCQSLGSDESTQADCRYMFAKSIFSCMTTLFTDKCPLSLKEKADYVRGIISQPQVKQRCRDTFGGFAPKLLCAVVRSGSVGLNLLVFWALALMSRLSPKLFTHLKHKK